MAEADVPALDTTGGIEETIYVFGLSSARCDKEKTYSWTPAAKIWGESLRVLFLDVRSKCGGLQTQPRGETCYNQNII